MEDFDLTTAEAVPKKVRAALAALGITNVVGGYSTRAQRWVQVGGSWRYECRAAFTCWDKHGRVVVTLYKGRGEAGWTLANQAVP